MYTTKSIQDFQPEKKKTTRNYFGILQEFHCRLLFWLNIDRKTKKLQTYLIYFTVSYLLELVQKIYAIIEKGKYPPPDPKKSNGQQKEWINMIVKKEMLNKQIHTQLLTYLLIY